MYFSVLSFKHISNKVKPNKIKTDISSISPLKLSPKASLQKWYIFAHSCSYICPHFLSLSLPHLYHALPCSQSHDVFISTIRVQRCTVTLIMNDATHSFSGMQCTKLKARYAGRSHTAAAALHTDPSTLRCCGVQRSAKVRFMRLIGSS